MPKDPNHILESQKQRKRLKEVATKYIPGRITLNVLGTGAEGAPRSLYVFTDQSRYLFNCGEGTQRLAHEHKMKLTKLEHIFITQSTWLNIGGLPGTALTIQDVGVPQITLHGPDGLEDLFAATQRFVIIKNLQIKMANCKPKDVFQDNVMSVYYIPIFKLKSGEGIDKETQSVCGSEDLQLSIKSPSRRNSLSSNEALEDNIDYYAHEPSRNSVLNTIGHNQSLSNANENMVMCYACKLEPRPGALNLDKCVKHGVPPGPLLGKLKNGEDITLPSGIVVKSQDVREPDDPGPVFLVVDCPSEEYLDSFVTNSAFERYQASTTRNDLLAYLIVHFTPQHIINNPRYRLWVDKFSPSTRHLILNENNTCMGSIAVHRVQHKLNMLHNSIFPLLNDKGSKYNNVNIQTKSDPLFKDNFNYAGTLCNFHLRPKKGLDRSSELTIIPAEYVDETMNLVNFTQTLKQLQESIADELKHSKIRPYPRLLFLGTGSCIPNKTRNTSGILLETSVDTNILMDCGEGTYGQIVRFFGREKVDTVLSNIKAVFISHLHADHHIGLIGLLKGRQHAMQRLKKENKPLLLLAPKQILTWLNFYDKNFENISYTFELIPNSELLHEEHTLFEGTKARIYHILGMSDINTTFVRHCPNAFGIAFNSKNGYKICYSGDTMPSENLINLGLNCDLLIHEATMEDELEDEAAIKLHSTTSQAIEVGRNMNAKFIMLTHFSQRYSKLPKFNDNFDKNIGIAFDNMQVKLDELPLVPLFYPALRLIFAEHYDEMEFRTMKRQLKLERQETDVKQKKVEEVMSPTLLERLEKSLYPLETCKGVNETSKPSTSEAKQYTNKIKTNKRPLKKCNKISAPIKMKPPTRK